MYIVHLSQLDNFEVKILLNEEYSEWEWEVEYKSKTARSKGI
jgi:hypothetical protein